MHSAPMSNQQQAASFSDPGLERLRRLGLIPPPQPLLFPQTGSLLQQHIPPPNGGHPQSAISQLPFHYFADSFNRTVNQAATSSAASAFFPYHRQYQPPFRSSVIDSIGSFGNSLTSPTFGGGGGLMDQLNTSAFRPIGPLAPPIDNLKSLKTDSPNSTAIPPDSVTSDHLVQTLKTFLLPQTDGLSPGKSTTSASSDVAAKDTPACSNAFDGTAVLCQVCGDKASGYHYGVHACEGCKGFFRRSIQQKIQYRPCSKNQQCSVLRINRNRCQYCRLKKCIAVGMSRDAVRFGRVPKKEKQKMIAEMQRANAKSLADNIGHELDDQDRLVTSVIAAHLQTCRFIKERLQLPGFGLREMTTSPIACPLNPTSSLSNGSDVDLSERYSPAIRGVVDFAKAIPGFHILPQEDQVTLLKAGMFEVLLLRLSVLFDADSNSMMLLDGSVYCKDTAQSPQQTLQGGGCVGAAGGGGTGRFLVDSLFDFVQRFNGFQLNDADIALYSAVVLIAPDRPGLRNAELVERMQFRLKEALFKVLALHHPTSPALFNQLLMKTPDLRTLNTLHQEKLLSFKVDHLHQHRQAVSSTMSDEGTVIGTAKDSLSDSSRTRTGASISDCASSSESISHNNQNKAGDEEVVEGTSRWSTACKASENGESPPVQTATAALTIVNATSRPNVSARCMTPLKIDPPACPVITVRKLDGAHHPALHAQHHQPLLQQWPQREASSFDSGKGTLSNRASSSDSGGDDDTDDEHHHRHRRVCPHRPPQGQGHRATANLLQPMEPARTPALSALKQALQAPPISAHRHLCTPQHTAATPPPQHSREMAGASLREKHQAVASLLESTPAVVATSFSSVPPPVWKSVINVGGRGGVQLPTYAPNKASVPLNAAATLYAHQSPSAFDDRIKSPLSRKSDMISPAHCAQTNSPKRLHDSISGRTPPAAHSRPGDNYDEQPLNLSKKPYRG